MPNTRFCSATDNKAARFLASNPYPRVINGLAGTQYPSAPPLAEDSQYPMSNVLNPDRYTPWATPSATAPATKLLHIDLGTNISVALVALFGMRWPVGSTLPTSCVAGFRLGTATQPTFGYASTGFTSAGTIQFTGSPRNAGLVLPAPSIGRYWEFSFEFALSSGFSVGAIYLGAITQDLGFLYSPGMDDELIHPTIRSRTGAGHLSVISVGDVRRLVSIPLESVEDSTRTKVDAVFGRASRREPAVWIDREDKVAQVVLADDKLSWRHSWGNPNLWDADLDLEVLG